MGKLPGASTLVLVQCLMMIAESTRNALRSESDPCQFQGMEGVSPVCEGLALWLPNLDDS